MSPKLKVRIGHPPLMQDVGERVVAALGEPAARGLLDVLERSDADLRSGPSPASEPDPGSD